MEWLIIVFAPVPVIVVFTKFDALSGVAFGELKEIPGLARNDILAKIPQRVEEIFANANILERLRQTRHPPKDYVRWDSKLAHHFHLYGV
jgi:hypothetical protein